MDLVFRFGLVIVFAVAAIIGILAGVSQSSSFGAPSTPAAAPTAIPAPPSGVVDIVPSPNSAGNPPGKYLPPLVRARVGQTVTWVNDSGVTFTVTADNGAFNSSVLSAGEKFHWTPRKPGTYTYGSFVDPGVAGTVIVTP